MDMRKRQEALAKVEAEIVKEKAASLGRVGRALEEAIAKMSRLRDDAEAAVEAERPAIVRAHNALREEARELYWKLMVQREALGLHNHKAIEAAYPLPPRLR